MFVLSLVSLFLAGSSIHHQSVKSYIYSESSVAKAGLLANIGPSGSKSSGANPGVVIASPSTSNPNYLYTWIRDSCLVFKVLIDQYATGEDSSLREQIDNFVHAENILQQTSNPSGSVGTGGLAEPKFNIDLSPFTEPWGRPQRDGPALRATALITFANWLIETGNSSFVTNTLWPIIKLDLDYVSENWNQRTFDLWEEINSNSFFTTAVQHRSLREGITLANAIGRTDVVSEYTTQGQNALCALQSYWNAGGSYITANTGGGRSGKDSNTVLASIHTFDPAAGCDATTYQPCSDKALSNLFVYVNSFRSIYGINGGIPSNAAIATGRYPEDVYFNGNPWYLCTFAVAEQLYDAIIVWKAQGSITVTALSQPFFQQFLSNVSPGTYDSSSDAYTSLLDGVQTFADGFIQINAKHTPPDGGLAEQYDKTNGTPLSAADLTWSYASALTAFNARAGKTYAGWGAKGLIAPSNCGGGNGITVEVTFNVQARTVIGEEIYITGSVAALKNWSSDDALSLSSADYPVWSVTVTVPASTQVEYKYIRKYNGQTTWESDPNRQITTPANGTYTANDSWR